MGGFHHTPGGLFGSEGEPCDPDYSRMTMTCSHTVVCLSICSLRKCHVLNECERYLCWPQPLSSVLDIVSHYNLNQTFPQRQQKAPSRTLISHSPLRRQTNNGSVSGCHRWKSQAKKKENPFLYFFLLFLSFELSINQAQMSLSAGSAQKG